MANSLPVRSTREPRSLGLFEAAPFRALRQELDDVMSRFLSDGNGNWLSEVSAPSTDVSETDEAVEVRMDLPGIDPAQIDLEVRGSDLRVTAERKEEKERKDRTVHRIERRAEKYSRTIGLPCGIKEDKVQAVYENGVLSITLPKTEESKPHRIAVKTK